MADIGAPSKRRGLVGWIIGVTLALIASLAALALVLTGIIPVLGATAADDEETVLLEAAEEPGEIAFLVATLIEPSSLITPIQKGAPIPQVAVEPAPAPGGKPGLYGGSGAQTCDVAQLVSFLGQNPDKAAAWVAALNADPKLRWGNGQPLTVADIPLYVENLVPGVLQSDTLVTNHGFRGNRAIPIRSLQQRGTAVLIDRFGVPRVRCMCGNPLTLPKPATKKLKFAGDPWEGLGKTGVSTIDPDPNGPLDSLQLTNKNGSIDKVAFEMCQRFGTHCPAPGPGNATAVPTPSSTPTSSATPSPSPTGSPTQSAPPSGFYKKDNPVTPAFDVCTAKWKAPKKEAKTKTFTITNQSSTEIDLWAPTMTWNNGKIETCKAEYIGTLPPGAYGEFWGPADMTWIAADSAAGTVVDKVKNDGTNWNIA